MLVEPDQTTKTVQFTSEDKAFLAEKLLQAMRETIYSNRMQVAPRRIKELAQTEIASIVNFMETSESQIVNEHGMMLAREGLGQKSIVSMTSALRLGIWEIIKWQSGLMETVNRSEDYTKALLNGYMSAYEEEQRREQQRTHEAFVRSINNA